MTLPCGLRPASAFHVDTQSGKLPLRHCLRCILEVLVSLIFVHLKFFPFFFLNTSLTHWLYVAILFDVHIFVNFSNFYYGFLVRSHVCEDIIYMIPVL